jgi:hypothetical protein
MCFPLHADRKTKRALPSSAVSSPGVPLPSASGAGSPAQRQKKKRGRYGGHYDPRAADYAVADFLDKHAASRSERKAAAEYGVPRSTFQHALKSARAAGQTSTNLLSKWEGESAGTKMGSAGRQTVLTKEEEDALEALCLRHHAVRMSLNRVQAS